MGVELTAWGRAIHTKMKADPATRGIQVVGPSLVGKYAPSTLGDQSAYMDAGNLHPYTGGLSPTPAHMASERTRMTAVSAGKPLVATEAGFHTAMSFTGAFAPVNEATSANYTVRTLLEHFLSGVQRTYIFQLLDPRDDPLEPKLNFGLIRYDGTPRPAFYAVKNLMTIVGTRGPSKVASLPYGIQGDTSDLRHFAVEQSDGSYLLFLWRTASVWNRDTKQPIAVPSKHLSLYLPTATCAGVGTPLSGTGMFPMTLDAATHRTSLDIAGTPLVLRVRTR